jgi:rhodanese-related sulfurtransferase
MQDVLNFLSNHIALSTSVAILIVLLIIVEFLRARRKGFALSPAQLIQFMNHQNATIIDIRANEAFRKAHIIGAHSLQSKDIQDNPKKLEKFKNRPVIIVCANGMESQKAASLLLKQSYHAYALAGGMRAWAEAAMPVIKE